MSKSNLLSGKKKSNKCKIYNATKDETKHFQCFHLFDGYFFDKIHFFDKTEIKYPYPFFRYHDL